MNAILGVPRPLNAPVLPYGPGSGEKKLVKATIGDLRALQPDIGLEIGGRQIRTGNLGYCYAPHDHKLRLAQYHQGGAQETQQAIDAALAARKDWARTSLEDRTGIFLKAAALLAGGWRPKLNAATMLSQSKNIFQAEIDAACELIDFLNFNCFYAAWLYAGGLTDLISPPGFRNHLEFRPLEGFVFAVSPFNFTSIAGNLPTAPAIMGNTVVWKPAKTQIFSAYFLMQLFKEAGLPDGVINMVFGPADVISQVALDSPFLAGIHFTGSTEVFQGMCGRVGANIAAGCYRTYPRLVGETGGKDFVMVHPSANRRAVATGLIRGAFEYQGQKCSAASRGYVPESMWQEVKEMMITDMGTMTMGTPENFTHFINAVIDRPAFERIKAQIEQARAEGHEVIGGVCDDSNGYFISPTLIIVKGPRARTMVEEVFGPVLTVHVYPDHQYQETLELCNTTSPYALTGSIFSTDRAAIRLASNVLMDAAGNFYINDKPTGAVVGQQPFGGARGSGTNDKAGSWLNLIRWASPRTTKETHEPPLDYRYTFMLEP